MDHCCSAAVLLEYSKDGRGPRREQTKQTLHLPETHRPKILLSDHMAKEIEMHEIVTCEGCGKKIALDHVIVAHDEDNDTYYFCKECLPDEIQDPNR